MSEGSSEQVHGGKLVNDMSVSWKRLTDCSFPLREGQCVCSCDNKMYVYGGVIQSHTEDLIESNDLLCFDGVSCTWSLVNAKGTLPEPRSAASLVSVDNKLYLFGGLNQESGWLDSLYVFNIGSRTWSKVESEGPHPSARDKLQATVVEKCVYYFGGFGPKMTGEDEEWEDMDDSDEDVLEEERTQQAAHFGWFNDLYQFDTACSKWSQPMHMNLGIPTARAAHGMCTVGRNIVIFGGRDTEKRTNDLHIYNIDTRKWNLDMKVKGELPVPRSFHSVTGVGNRVVVMGGRAQDNSHLADFHVFDTETFEWLQPKVNGDIPDGRGQHSVAVVGDQLVLYGGSSEFSPETMMCHKFHGDTFVLSTVDVLKGKSLDGPVKTNGHKESGSDAMANS